MASERQSYKKNMESIVAKMSEVFMDIQDLKKREIKPKMQEKKVKPGPYVSEDASNCGLCKRLKNLDIQPKDNKHHISARGNLEPESCGQLRNMNIKEMAELFRSYEMCRVCAYKPITDTHQEEKCNYTTRVSLAKCKVKNCRYRYFLCDQHIDKNKASIEHRTEYYMKNNFPVTFYNDKQHPAAESITPSLKIDVSTQTVDEVQSKTQKKDTDLSMDSTTTIPVPEDRTSESSPEESMTDYTEAKNPAVSNLQ